MPLEPVTVQVRGRAQVIPVDELRAELDAEEGAPRSLAHLEAVVRCNDPAAAVRRLRRVVRRGDAGVTTLQAVFGLVRLEARDAAADLEALAQKLGGSPGAIAQAASLLVAGRADALAVAVAADAVLAHASPQPYLHLPTVPSDATALFGAWTAVLREEAPRTGVTALRAFVGDVAEAAFRSLQHGARPNDLLGDADREFLVDLVCGELPGTTDFIAARGMSWLLGALERHDETARAAIERARERFRDPEFQADCEAMLTGAAWPPRPHP
ncbi:MAG: hypothetical protein JWN44_3175 [Myxococcales bacterium]|nr:hypothetical protein [Myxococcales bacterium]